MVTMSRTYALGPFRNVGNRYVRFDAKGRSLRIFRGRHGKGRIRADGEGASRGRAGLHNARGFGAHGSRGPCFVAVWLD